MGFEYVSKLPTPDEIRAQFPLAPALAAEKAKKDEPLRTCLQEKAINFSLSSAPAPLIGRLCLRVRVPSDQGAGKSKGQADSDSQNLHQ